MLLSPRTPEALVAWQPPLQLLRQARRPQVGHTPAHRRSAGPRRGPRFTDPSCPPLPNGHPSRRPLHVTRTIPRSVELQAEEDALAAMALVVLVDGTRPLLAPYQVRRYSQGNYGRPGSSFSLHRHWLEDFLIIFRNHEDLLHVLNAPPLPVANIWCSAFDDGPICQLRTVIRCGPAHAWSAATAHIVLGDACARPEPTPSTAARADLRRFQAVVWCSDPDLIPNEATIRIQKHVNLLGDNPLFCARNRSSTMSLTCLNTRLK
jgi:hypothetical protein